MLFTINGVAKEFLINHLVVAGWTARDQHAVQEHIDELAELDVQLGNHTEPHTHLLSLNRKIEQKMSNLQDLARNLVTSHNLADKLNWEEAKVEIMQWQYQYNNVRPHSSLNYLPPVAFAEKAA